MITSSELSQLISYFMVGNPYWIK
uniref:Uncharacterized protein n=1 Tax=Anguilla anguilla TaxID=7936 RepID=A0A0E9TK03_ANGAN